MGANRLVDDQLLQVVIFPEQREELQRVRKLPEWWLEVVCVWEGETDIR